MPLSVFVFGFLFLFGSICVLGRRMRRRRRVRTMIWCVVGGRLREGKIKINK